MDTEFQDIESIIMSHSQRGMPILREYLPSNYCKEAAEYILSWKKGVIFIATGFYVAGHAETDGPPGALIISLVLKKLGYTPVILTDKYCQSFFEKYEIKVDKLIISSVSNWGGYGLVAYLCNLTKNKQFFETVEKTVKDYIKFIISLGSVDGITHENVEKVDGFDIDIELDIIRTLLKVI